MTNKQFILACENAIFRGGKTARRYIDETGKADFDDVDYWNVIEFARRSQHHRDQFILNCHKGREEKVKPDDEEENQALLVQKGLESRYFGRL